PLENPECVQGKAKTWPTKTNWFLSGDSLNMFLGFAQLRLDLVFSVQVQPGFVVERVIANLVAGISYRTQGSMIFFAGSILTNDKKGNLQVPLLQKIQHTRHDNIKICRELFPVWI